MRKTNQTLPAVEMSPVRDQVLLVVPARPEMWSIVRMTASVLASRIELSFEDVEDLRLAVTELCSSCAVDAAEEATCEARFEISSDRFELHLDISPVVASVAQASEQGALSMLELSDQILGATVDSHSIDPVQDGLRHAYLCKDSTSSALR
jgi:serine/threonine-protein kinase RsbW